jgi:hypothetical protein
MSLRTTIKLTMLKLKFEADPLIVHLIDRLATAYTQYIVSIIKTMLSNLSALY